MKSLKNYQERLEDLANALPLLFQKPTRYSFLHSIELLYSLKGIAIQALADENRSRYALMLDVYRRRDPKVSTVIGLDTDEYEKLKTRLRIENEQMLIGFGWDLFDLPYEVRLKKAVPAILLEVSRIRKELEDNQSSNEPFNIQDMRIKSRKGQISSES